jgi:hypothetical protein
MSQTPVAIALALASPLIQPRVHKDTISCYSKLKYGIDYFSAPPPGDIYPPRKDINYKKNSTIPRLLQE